MAKNEKTQAVPEGEKSNAPAATAPAATNQKTALPRMSIKDLNLDPKAARKLNAGKSLFLCRILGVMNEAITKEDPRTTKEYTYFVGDFVAITKAGQFESSKLFLPGTALEEKMSAEVGAANGASVEFGFDIFALADPEGTIGYKYAWKSIVKSAVSDRVAQLSESVASMALPE